MDKATIAEVIEYRDGDLYWRVSRGTAKKGDLVGSMRSDGYVKFQFQRKNLYVHHVVWLLHHDKWPEHEIDHIDRDRANNVITNLRDVTRSQNHENRIAEHVTYRDVNTHRPYVADIKRDGVRYYKAFATEDEARNFVTAHYI